MRSFAEIEAEIDGIANAGLTPQEAVARLVAIGEEILEHWIIARGETPTSEQKEGFPPAGAA